MGKSPNGARKSGGLDFEAVGQCAKVQIKQEKTVDWTLKLQKSKQKSKSGKEVKKIGLLGVGEAYGSPNRAMLVVIYWHCFLVCKP